MEKILNRYKKDIEDQSKYKTVRIYPKDFRYLKNEAYHKDTTIVNYISSLISEKKKKSLEEKMDKIGLLYFVDNHHKEIFLKYLEDFPYEAESNDNLVIFYTYAAIGIYDEKVDFKKKLKNETFTSNLDDKYQQIVMIASLLLDKDYTELLRKLARDDFSSPVAKEITILSLYNLDEIAEMRK